MAAQADDLIHTWNATKVLSVGDICTFCASATGSVQFVESAADVPAGPPPDTAEPAYYLGNVNGTFYVWSIANAAWVPIVSI